MLSQRAQRLKPSPTIRLNTLAKELKAAGRDIVNMAAGEPDWDTFDNVKEACRKALDSGMTKYVPAAGLPQLREAVVHRCKEDLGLSYDPSQCVIGMGAKQIIFTLLQVLCDPGDEVIIPSPYWVSYPTMAELADAKPVVAVCPKETGFKLTPELLKRSLTAKTKVLLLNSPNNPTGQVYSAQELKDLASILEKTGVWVISDDIYDKMIFTGEKIAPHIAQQSEKLRERILIVNALSKTYSMTGWRIGTVLGDAKVVKACASYQSQNVTCAVPFAQMGAVEALTGPQDSVVFAMEQLSKRMKTGLDILKSIEGFDVLDSQGAFYLFPDISGVFGKKSPKGEVINSSSQFSQALLDAEGVVAVPGSDFGAEGFIRVSATIEESRLVEGLNRMKKFVESLS